MYMVLFDLLQMTKAKIAILILLLVFFIPSYLNLSCLSETGGACGFLPLEFFVTFVWVYVIAALIVELALFLRRKIKKKE